MAKKYPRFDDQGRRADPYAPPESSTSARSRPRSDTLPPRRSPAKYGPVPAPESASAKERIEAPSPESSSAESSSPESSSTAPPSSELGSTRPWLRWGFMRGPAPSEASSSGSGSGRSLGRSFAGRRLWLGAAILGLAGLVFYVSTQTAMPTWPNLPSWAQWELRWPGEAGSKGGGSDANEPRAEIVDPHAPKVRGRVLMEVVQWRDTPILSLAGKDWARAQGANEPAAAPASPPAPRPAPNPAPTPAEAQPEEIQPDRAPPRSKAAPPSPPDDDDSDAWYRDIDSEADPAPDEEEEAKDAKGPKAAGAKPKGDRPGAKRGPRETRPNRPNRPSSAKKTAPAPGAGSTPNPQKTPPQSRAATPPPDEAPQLRWPQAQREAPMAMGRLDFEGATMELRPALGGQCRVALWKNGEPRVSSQSCGQDGSFSLSVPRDLRGPAWVVIAAKDRLRAQVPVNLTGEGLDIGSVALGYGFFAGIQVVDPKGAPLVGVRAQARSEWLLPEHPSWWAQSSKEGVIAWDDLPSGQIQVELSYPGFRSVQVGVAAPMQALRQVVMEPVKPIWGQVYAQHVPEGQWGAAQWKKVKVRLAGSGIWPPREVNCGADGGFYFKDIPAGIYAVEALYEGASQSFASYPLENVRTDHALSLALIPAGSISVKVQDQRGAAVANAKVMARGNELGLLQRHCVTDPNGECRLPALVPSRYEISANPEGFVAAQAQVELLEAKEQSLVLSLQTAGLCSLWIRDPEGKAMPNVELLLEEIHDASLIVGRLNQSLVAVSDEQGRADFASLADGQYQLRISAPGWVMQGPMILDPQKQCEDLQLRLWPATQVRGQVLDPQGGSIAGATIELLAPGQARSGRGLSGQARSGRGLSGQARSGRGRSGRGRGAARTKAEAGGIKLLSAQSDEQGFFDLGSARGEGRLRVHAPGFRTLFQNVNFDPQKQAQVELELRLESRAEGEPLSMEFFGPKGRAVPGLWVQLEDPSGRLGQREGRSDRSGLVRFGKLEPGTWKLRVRQGRQSVLERSIEWDGRSAEPRRFDLKARWTVIVEVVDDRGEPIRAASLRLDGRNKSTGRRGKAVFRELAREQLGLEIEAEGWVPRRLDLRRPERMRNETMTLRVEMTLAGTIRGEIFDPWGENIPGARLRLRWTQGEVRTTSAESGSFELRNVPPGDWTMQVIPPSLRADLQVRSLEVNVRSGAVTQDVFVELEKR